MNVKAESFPGKMNSGKVSHSSSRQMDPKKEQESNLKRHPIGLSELDEENVEQNRRWSKRPSGLSDIDDEDL